MNAQGDSAGEVLRKALRRNSAPEFISGRHVGKMLRSELALRPILPGCVGCTESDLA